jgi:hypothetical protein
MSRYLGALLALMVAGCAQSPAAPESTSSTSAATIGAPSPSIDAAPSAGDAAPSANATPSSSAQPQADPLLAVALTDVRSGETFTLAELAADGPVLVETMAIWCVNCLGQQREVVGAHDLVAFDSVSIDVDPNERADDLAAYAEREGFDWRFAVADTALATTLRDRFSPAVLNPPSMPKLLIRDGAVELVGLNEQLSADEIAALVAA